MQIHLHEANKTWDLQVDAEQSLYAQICAHGAEVSAPCGGAGKCGKCRAYVFGEVTPPDETERGLLTQAELADGMRLLCRCYPRGTCTVILPQVPWEQVVPFSAEEPLDAVMDIGTTTICSAWISQRSGEVVHTDSIPNPQAAFGADVISRMEHAAHGARGEIEQSVQTAVARLLAASETPPGRTVIAGNTVMLHFYTGVDTAGMLRAPFTPQTLFGTTAGGAYLPPCISAFVGADITAAILASGMLHTPQTLLVDLGTNGEMAYWDGETLRVCATACGPAFEGVGLRCGGAARAGGIFHVSEEQGTWQVQTIADQPASFLCGSGAIDLTAALCRRGVIDPNGYLENTFVLPGTPVCLTPGDVRNLQLAKAAIAAGIKTICPDPFSLRGLYISGCFGEHLELSGAVALGLLPPLDGERVHVMGNGALRGAALLLREENRRDCAALAARAETVNLSCNAVFSEHFMEAMTFSPDVFNG